MIPWGNPGFVTHGDTVVFLEPDPEIDGPPKGEPETANAPPASAVDAAPKPQE